MTDTRFAVGPATAYLTDHVLALGEGGSVDAAAMALCASADWDRIVAGAREHRLDVVAMHEAGQVRFALGAGATVVVATDAGDRRFAGSDAWTLDTVDGARVITLVTGRCDDAGAPTYRTDGGAVPASVVWRRLGAPPAAPIDPFDALFGHTVVRSVESAAIRPVEQPSGRSAVGVLVFSTGQRLVLDTNVLLGRNPRPDTAAGTTHGTPYDPRHDPRHDLRNDARDDAPRLLKVAHPGVSRRHAAITVDRWIATIRDLGSVNGTTVTVPGGAAVPLRPGEPCDLPIGACVELGTDVSFTVEEAA